MLLAMVGVHWLAIKAGKQSRASCQRFLLRPRAAQKAAPWIVRGGKVQSRAPESCIDQALCRGEGGCVLYLDSGVAAARLYSGNRLPRWVGAGMMHRLLHERPDLNEIARLIPVGSAPENLYCFPPKFGSAPALNQHLLLNQ